MQFYVCFTDVFRVCRLVPCVAFGECVVLVFDYVGFTRWVVLSSFLNFAIVRYFLIVV